MVLDPMSMCAHDCGPSEGLLHTPSAGTQKKKQLFVMTPVETYLHSSKRTCVLLSFDVL